MAHFKSYWFLFEVIIKSIILHLNDTQQMTNNTNVNETGTGEGEDGANNRTRSTTSVTSGRNNFVSKNFQRSLQKLIPRLLTTLEFSYDVIVAFPLFINNLFPVMDRGILFKIVCRFVVFYLRQCHSVSVNVSVTVSVMLSPVMCRVS